LPPYVGVLAMNRLRHAYLQIAPALEPYFSTSHHDDEQGLAASYLLARFHRGGQRPWGRFLVNTPTVIATVDAAVDAAVVAAIAVLAARAVEATTTVAVVAGTAAFLLVWTALLRLERQTLDPLRRTRPRFPTPPDQA
jgi:hypothetical protein